MSGQGHSNNRMARAKLGLVSHDNTGGYFIVECQGCGVVYPSFQCGGGDAIADTGDYNDAICPHCGQESPEECSNVGLVWNTQQLKINELQQRLNAADECWDKLVSAVRSINRSPHYMVKAIDDDQPQYRQRKEWIDWVLGLCDAAPSTKERSNKDYAIEHAEYMAKSADDVLAKFQAYGLALLAVDEGGDDGEGELFENIDSARGNLQESLVDLRSMVYEFRKRAAKSR
ncbi:hypothetical protein [Pseudomonas sp. KT_2_4]|uniref:hypothetical protein n=1 Tax=Pseudomonas sp. KT_2_4 TaxID=3241600 RepID=UPI00352B28F1